MHTIDQLADTNGTLGGHEHKEYKDDQGRVLVETVLIRGMGHGTPIKPGSGDDRCGKAAPFILNVGVCSTSHILKFWGSTRTSLSTVIPATRRPPSPVTHAPMSMTSNAIRKFRR